MIKKTYRLSLLSVFIFLVLLVFPLNSSALILSFEDPVGDHSGIVDVVGMNLDIEDTSGNYTIEIFSDSVNPFTGNFRINVNLFNVTQNEFFQDGFNDFDITGTLASIELTGTDSILADWLGTNTYSTTHLQGLGLPTGSVAFRSAVSDLPFQSILVAEDIIGYADRAPVPEPSTILLLGGGLLGLGWYGRKRKKI